jgi:hypothetical protein
MFGEVPSTGAELSVEGAVSVGVNVLAIAAVVGLTYLGVKAVLTGRNPLARS